MSWDESMTLEQIVCRVVLVNVVCAFVGFSANASSPQLLNLQGRLLRPDGSAVETSNVEFNVQIRSPGAESCILYEEIHTLNMATTDGLFSLKLGTGIRTGSNFKDLSSFKQVFDNSASAISALSCATGSAYDPSFNDARKLRLSFNDGSGSQTLSQDQTITSVPYAMYADTLQGKAPSDFMQVIPSLEATPGTSQTRVNQLFDTDWANLSALLGGTSNLYAKAAPTTAVDYNGQRAINVADPTSAQDAATKNYSDTKIGGNAAVIGVLATGDAGKALTWDGSKWIAQTPSITDATKLPLTGGTMTGAINMGSQNIISAGHIQLAPLRTLLLGKYDNAQEATLTTGLVAADAGRVWFNTDINRQRLWDGSSATDVGSSTLTVGTTAGTAMGADAVPNCTGSQKLQMSLGPTYAWTCITDSTTDPNAVAKAGDTMTGVLNLPANGLVAGTNQLVIAGGNVGIGTTSPTAALMLKAGTASAGMAPLKFSSGVNLTSPEAGAMEFDGTNLYFTDIGAVRRTIATTSAVSGTYLPLAGGSMTGSIVTSAGTVAAPALNFETTGNTGFYSPAAGNVRFVSYGADRFRFNNNGLTAATVFGPNLTTAAGTETAPAFSFNSDDDTGMFRAGTNQLGFATNALERLRIDANGNVGIGTISPGYKLDVAGALNATSIKVNGVDVAAGGGGTSAASQTFNSDSDNSGADGGFNFQRNGTNLVTVNNAGDVVINSTTASTNYGTGALVVAGGLGVGGNISSAGRIALGYSVNNAYTGSSVANPYPGGASFFASNYLGLDTSMALQILSPKNTAGTTQYAYIGASATTGAGVYSPSIVFGQATGASAYSERMRIDSSGNVGIGTTAPTAPLDVNGYVKATDIGIHKSINDDYLGAQPVGAQLYIENSQNGTNNNSATVVFNPRGNANTIAWMGATRAGQNAWSDLVFGGRHAGGFSEYVRIKSGGNVGIGTTSPTSLLDVVTIDTSSAASDRVASRASLSIRPTANQPAGSANSAFRSEAIIPSSNNKNINYVVGVNAYVENNSTGGTALSLNGIEAGAYNGTGNATYVTGSYNWSESAAGSVANLIGTSTESYVVGGNVTAQTGHLIYLERTGGTVTNRYGIYIDVPVGSATNDFAFYSAGNQKSYFAGNVGIGTTSPGQKLTVAGNIAPSVTNSYDLGTSSVLFRDAFVTNGVTTTSDARKKTEIKDSDLGLDFVNSLRPVSYYWKQGDNRLHYGVIAQETEQALGRAKAQSGRTNEVDNVIVTHDERTDAYGVRYSELIAPMIKAIQEIYRGLTLQDVRLVRLEAENQKLKKENQDQTKELAALKAWVCLKDKNAAICK